MTIGERIRFVRKSENIHLTLEKFGERIGMKKVHSAKWKMG